MQVLTRYLLEKLFGPQVVGATSDNSYMYVDLPPNMVSFFHSPNNEISYFLTNYISFV